MTTSVMPTIEHELPLGTPRGTWGTVWWKLTRRPVTVICMITVAVYFLMAAMCYTSFAQAKVDEHVGDSYVAPSLVTPGMWLGTDVQGRSVFWRCLYGARVDITIGVVAVTIETVVGLILGILAGYFGGWVDDVILWLVSVVSTVPWILLVIALITALKGQMIFGHELTDLWIAILALGLTGWPGLCRLIRGETLKVRDLDYVTAARAMGLRTPRILVKYVVPNVFHLVIVNASIDIVAYVQAEVVLSFLGIGITSDPSWGRMIDDARLEMLRGVWWQLVPATVAIFVLSLAMNFLGDALRDALDPRLSGGGK